MRNAFMALTCICVSSVISSTQELYARHFEFNKTVGGKDCGKVVVEYNNTANGYEVSLDMPDRKNTFITDKKHYSTEWKHSNSGDKSSYVVSRNGGTYEIKGTLKGGAIEKIVKSQGLPWVQDITIEAMELLGPSSGTVQYECFRPDDVSLHSMQAILKGEREINGQKMIYVRVCPTGMLAKVWGIDLYFDPETHHLTRYEAVEGVPGTPRTVWQ